jgi:excisionase family DNA binding protein
MDAPKPFTARMLADRWSCSESYIYRLIDTGKLRAFHLGGKLKRISWEEVCRWEGSQSPKSQTIAPTLSAISDSDGGAIASAPPGMKAQESDAAIDLASRRRSKLARSCMRSRARI